MIDELSYAAQSWERERRVITRLKWGEQGHNPRFVVTNLHGDATALYDGLYCQRGEAENRIKEAQVGLFATRTGCHVFAANQLRMLLAAQGYVLIERLRARAAGHGAGHRAGRYAAYRAAQGGCRDHPQHPSHPAG